MWCCTDNQALKSGNSGDTATSVPGDFKSSIWNSGDNGMGATSGESTELASRSYAAPSSPISTLFQSKTTKQTRTSIYNLKAVLIADDRALLAEANELRRLTDPSTWIDAPNNGTPPISEVTKCYSFSKLKSIY